MQPLIIDYVNWKGRRGIRKVFPVSIEFRSSEYHNGGQPCWIMSAIDPDKGGEPRDFEMTSIVKSMIL